MVTANNSDQSFTILDKYEAEIESLLRPNDDPSKESIKSIEVCSLESSGNLFLGF